MGEMGLLFREWRIAGASSRIGHFKYYLQQLGSESQISELRWNDLKAENHVCQR
jgi:hypothetical protein